MIKSRAAPQAPSPTPPQSIDAVRRRARHRLIGASMLVLVGVVGFSLLFDTQPRPIAVDIPIEIPAKAVPVAPAANTAPAVAQAPEQPEPAKAAEQTTEPVVDAKPADPPAQPEPETTVAAAPPADPPPVLAPVAPSSATSSSKTTPGTAGSGSAPVAAPSGSESASLRLVVQVGAFAETARAQEVRQKIERAGLKTYTHVAQTSQGKRIRVRLGPYSSRAEAEKAASRVKALGYPAAILTL